MMSRRPVYVLDASVGVKWFRPEQGHEGARALYVEHMADCAQIVVPAHFLHEVVASVLRREGVDAARDCWDTLQDAGLTVVSLDDGIADAAFTQCRALRCSFYDALAPGLAEILGATLYSADKKAHAAFEGAVIIG